MSLIHIRLSTGRGSSTKEDQEPIPLKLWSTYSELKQYGFPECHVRSVQADTQQLQQARQHTIHLVVRDWASAPTASAPPQRTASVPPDTFHLPAPPGFNPFQNPTAVPRPSSQPTFHPPVDTEHYRRHLQAHQRALQQAEQARLAQRASLHARPTIPQQQPPPQNLPPQHLPLQGSPPQALPPLPQGFLPPGLNAPPNIQIPMFQAVNTAVNDQIAAMQEHLADLQTMPDLVDIISATERLIWEQTQTLRAQHESRGIAPLPGPDERRRTGYPTLEQMRAIVLVRERASLLAEHFTDGNRGRVS